MKPQTISNHIKPHQIKPPTRKLWTVNVPNLVFHPKHLRPAPLRSQKPPVRACTFSQPWWRPQQRHWFLLRCASKSCLSGLLILGTCRMSQNEPRVPRFWFIMRFPSGEPFNETNQFSSSRVCFISFHFVRRWQPNLAGDKLSTKFCHTQHVAMPCLLNQQARHANGGLLIGTVDHLLPSWWLTCGRTQRKQLPSWRILPSWK